MDLLKTAGDSRDICTLLEEWHLSQEMHACLKGFGVEPGRADATVRLMTGLLSSALQGPLLLSELTAKLTADHNLGNYLQVNQYEGILWFNQERFQRLTYWLMATEVLSSLRASSSEPALIERAISAYAAIKQIKRAERLSGYQVNGLSKALSRSKLIFP